MAVNPTGTPSSFADAERAAEVEIALGVHRPAHVEPERGRDGAQRHAGARDERLEQHVAGAGEQAGAAGRRMQPGLDERAAGGHAARDALVAERALGAQRHERRGRVLAVARLQRRLGGLELSRVHLPLSSRACLAT